MKMRRIIFIRVGAAFLSAVGMASCGSDKGATDPASSASQIAIISGNNQTGASGNVLALPLTVKVSNASGVGVAGVRVRFASAGGGGSLAPSNPATNSSGIAESAWTLGPTTTQKATATVEGLSGSPLTFSATATAPPQLLRELNYR